MQQNQPKFNNFPKDSKLNVKPTDAEKDTVILYRLIDSYNPVTKKYHLRTQGIPQQDFVSDPDTGETYHIALIKRELPDGTYEFDDVVFEDNAMCIKRVDLRSPVGLKLFKFMEISNYNGSNPNRDKSATTPLFERITATTDFDFSRAHRKQVKAAYALIDTMSPEDVRAFIKATPRIVVSAQDDETLLNALEEFAAVEPQSVLGASVVGLSEFSTEIDQLIESKAISFDRGASEWHLRSGKPILRIPKTFAGNAKGELIKFLMKEDDVLNEIRDEAMKGQATEKVAPAPAPKKPK